MKGDSLMSKHHFGISELCDHSAPFLTVICRKYKHKAFPVCVVSASFWFWSRSDYECVLKKKKRM